MRVPPTNPQQAKHHGLLAAHLLPLASLELLLGVKASPSALQGTAGDRTQSDVVLAVTGSSRQCKLTSRKACNAAINNPTKPRQWQCLKNKRSQSRTLVTLVSGSCLIWACYKLFDIA